MTSFNSKMIICFILLGVSRISFKSLIASSSFSMSWSLFKMYSLFKCRNLISATYSAWILSILKPIIRFGTTSASSSVFLIIFIALSISSKIFSRPRSRWSLSEALFRSNAVLRLMQFVLNAIHSLRSSATPRTLGYPLMRTLKLHEKVSCNGVVS